MLRHNEEFGVESYVGRQMRFRPPLTVLTLISKKKRKEFKDSPRDTTWLQGYPTRYWLYPLIGMYNRVLKQYYRGRTMKEKIVMALSLAMSTATPVYAVEVQDFDTTGNVSMQQQSNDNDRSDNWIIVDPGRSGRGIKTVDGNGKIVVSVGCYDGVYVGGKLYINGKEYKKDNNMKAAFTPINGFLYVTVIFFLLLDLIRLSKKG